MTLSKMNKKAWQVLIDNLCHDIDKSKKKNKADKVPYGYYVQLVNDMKDIAPWLTLSIIKKAFAKYT